MCSFLLKNNRIVKNLFLLIFASMLIFILTSCSINKMAVKAISGSFGGGAIAVFSSDGDPELIKDSLPVLLKLHEVMMDADPQNYEVKASAGKLFTIYSNLFIQTPAEMMSYTQWDEQYQLYARAKKMYMRAFNYLKQSIEIKYKTQIDLTNKNSITVPFKQEDVDTLYWLGASIMSAVSIDLTDPIFAPYRDTGIAIMTKAYELDPDYGNGALHEFFLMYSASVTEGMGGGIEKAEYHYKKAVEISKGSKVSPYIGYAKFVVTGKEPQESAIAEFKQILNTVIEFDVDKFPENRLENTVNKKKAEWILKNIDDYFLID